MSEMNKEDLRKFLAEINDDDLQTMFNSKYPSAIVAKDLDAVEQKAMEYLEYIVPCSVGDVISIDNEKVYTVTLVYTDNSIDVVDSNATKKNIGVYGKDVKIITQLDCIIDNRFDK